MDKCIIDTSTCDLIQMIGGQLLLLTVVLLVIFYGKMPMAFPLATLAPLATNSNSGKAPNANNSKNNKNSLQ